MRPNWLIIGLIASLALNLFLIGAGAGVVALGAKMAKQGPAAWPGALFWATQPLPQPDRHDFRQMLGGLRKEVTADAQRSLALRADAWSALADAKPDVAAIDAKLAQSRQIDIGVRQKAEEKTVAYAAALPPADRQLFGGAMRHLLTSPADAAKPAKPQ